MSLGALALIIGLVLLILTAYHLVGIVLIVVGAILLLARGPWVGRGSRRGYWW